jgi:hypothetical protein
MAGMVKVGIEGVIHAMAMSEGGKWKEGRDRGGGKEDEEEEEKRKGKGGSVI